MLRAPPAWTDVLGGLAADPGLPLSRRVHDVLFQAIVGGRIPPGSHLPEIPIAEALGVSRVAVREAVRALTGEGLAEVYPNRGAFTVAFTVQDIEEVFSLRSALEALAARLATQKLGRTDLARLEDVLDDMREVDRSEDRFASAWIDAQFHRVLMEVSGHRRAIRAWHGLNAQITMVVYNSSSYFPDIHGLADRHAPIIEALRSGDADLAERVVVQHIFDGGRLLLEAVRRDDAANARDTSRNEQGAESEPAPTLDAADGPGIRP